MTIEEIIKDWESESKIDVLHMNDEIARIPNLHSKYVGLMARHGIKAKAAVAEYHEWRAIMRAWYRGELNNTEDLERYKLEPYLGPKIMQGSMEMQLEGDPRLNKILMRKVYHEEVVELCKSILREISNRTWQVRTIIEWNKLQNAGY